MKDAPFPKREFVKRRNASQKPWSGRKKEKTQKEEEKREREEEVRAQSGKKEKKGSQDFSIKSLEGVKSVLHDRGKEEVTSVKKRESDKKEKNRQGGRNTRQGTKKNRGPRELPLRSKEGPWWGVD